MLVKLWEHKFDSEVRGIDVADINLDGLDEAVIASYDSKIYAISHDKVIWSTREQEFSGENVMVIKTATRKPYRVIGSFHRELVYFNLDGKELHKISLSSWIVRLINLGSNRRGIDDILVIDLRGNIYLVDSEGNVLWSIEKILKTTDLSHVIYGIAVDKESQRIFLANKRRIGIISFDGTLQQTREITSKDIRGIATINVAQKGSIKTKMLAIGAKGEVVIIDPDTSKEVAKFDFPNRCDINIMFSCDVDSDVNDELFAGSWSEDKVFVLKYDSEEEKLKKIAVFEVEGNPLFISASDLRGDFRKEVFIGTDEDRAYLIAWPNEINEFEASVSFHGVCFGNTLGYGPQDILLRSTRETLACYSLIPRVWSKITDPNSLRGTLFMITPQSAKIGIDEAVVLDNKNWKTTSRSFEKKKILFHEVPFKAEQRGRAFDLYIRMNGKTLLKSYALVPAVEHLTTSTRCLALAEEDVIFIDDIKIDKRKLEIESKGLKIINFSIEGDKIKLTVLRNTTDVTNAVITICSYDEKTKKKQILRSYNFIIVPLETLQVELQLNDIITTDDHIIICLRNNSGKKLPYKIISDGPISIKTSGELSPRSEKQIKLAVSVKSDDLQIDANQVLDLIYGEHLKRAIRMPIRSRVLNVNAINERAKRIYNTTKDSRVILETLSRELNLSEEILKSIIKL